jgi:hypothetical protein
MSSKSKPEIQPKVIFDEELLEALNEFYKAKLTLEEVLPSECFSDPDLKSHMCNVQALREGDLPCPTCRCIPGRYCNVTCHIHYFCLAAYASRLGIGVATRAKGSKIAKAIDHNLSKLSYEELYKLILECKVAAVDEYPSDNVQMELKLRLGSPPKGEVVHREKSSLDPDMITIYEAAKVYECTYANMYNHVNRGNLPKFDIGGSVYVSRKMVLEFKEKVKNK